MFFSVSPVTYPEGERVLVNLAHVLSMVAEDGRVTIQVVPDRSPQGETILARGTLQDFDALPGLFRTTLVRPHGDPVPALVNLPAMVQVAPCQEGCLLSHGLGSHGRRFPIGSSLPEAEAHLEDVRKRS